MKTIRVLAAELAAGKTTSVQLVTEALQRIEAHRAEGGAAYVRVDAEKALAAAQASDAARAAGQIRAAGRPSP